MFFPSAFWPSDFWPSYLCPIIPNVGFDKPQKLCTPVGLKSKGANYTEIIILRGETTMSRLSLKSRRHAVLGGFSTRRPEYLDYSNISLVVGGQKTFKILISEKKFESSADSPHNSHPPLINSRQKSPIKVKNVKSSRNASIKSIFFIPNSRNASSHFSHFCQK